MLLEKHIHQLPKISFLAKASGPTNKIMAGKEAPTFFTSIFPTWILYQSSTYGASERLECRLLNNQKETPVACEFGRDAGAAPNLD